MTDLLHPFMLSESDKRNPLWLRLSDHLRKRLADLRGRNDGPLDEMQTAALRGQIQSLKGLLALAEMPPTDGTHDGTR